jgi:hypothetical protein
LKSLQLAGLCRFAGGSDGAKGTKRIPKSEIRRDSRAEAENCERDRRRLNGNDRADLAVSQAGAGDVVALVERCTDSIDGHPTRQPGGDNPSTLTTYLLPID